MIKKLKKIFTDGVRKSVVFRYLRVRLKFIFFLKNRLIDQLSLKHDFVLENEDNSRILIPLIETSHYQFYQVLALAKALSVRGAKIKLLLCGSQLNGCELKSIRSGKIDPCLTCRFNKENIIPLFNFDTVEIGDYISNNESIELCKEADKVAEAYPKYHTYLGINIIPMVNDSVDRYFYGATPREDSTELKLVRRQHIETSMIGVRTAKKLFKEWRPTQLLGNMNVYSAWEPYARVAENNRIKFNLISMSTFDFNKVVLNRQDLYFSDIRFKQWKNKRKVRGVTTSEKEELKKFIQTRFDGVSKIFLRSGQFKNPDLSYLKIDPNKRNIFLFSNIYWDAGLSAYDSLYKGVVPWVLDTIEILKECDNCHLYIKPHPAEFFDPSISEKGVEDFIREKFPILPDNVSIISPELKIKPYDLFPFIDVGLVYNGTLALEMLWSGIPVIGAGLSPYNHLNSISIPETRTRYMELLLGHAKIAKNNSNEIELFLYFYFIKSLIPWTLTERAFNYPFKEYNFQSIDELKPGNDKYLDHLCDCILYPDLTVVENW
jgi:hypothetical protein